MGRALLECLTCSILILPCWTAAASGASDQPIVDETPGATHYVNSESGSDANDGASPDSAFRTLKPAVAALDRSGGDTLVLSGTFRETLNLFHANAMTPTITDWAAAGG